MVKAWALVLACSAGVLVGPVIAGTADSSLHFRVYAKTGIRLTGVVWIGGRFLYIENTTNRIWVAGKTGGRRGLFASMPKESEETRCVPSPGTHGFTAGDLYCHAPDNTLYRIGPQGTVATFGKLPETAISDGAIAFDTVGRFGFSLLAATGRSGAKTSGGAVYSISPAGTATLVGRYAAKGGADEIAVAPAGFGRGAGQLVLTVDAGKTGVLLMMGPDGRSRAIASLPDGPNPIVVVPESAGQTAPGVHAGLYVTDTNSKKVFFAPGSAFAGYAGDLVVGTELGASFWVVRPHGGGFQTRRLPAAVPGSNFNLEGAVYVA